MLLEYVIIAMYSPVNEYVTGTNYVVGLSQKSEICYWLTLGGEGEVKGDGEDEEVDEDAKYVGL